ncbi:hypothetical protein LB535_10210 [Mesorhizobium sp. CA10]|uniref:hypothetical protein n=1 Tax=unclassified Mesorhizobium TaxID=325217 RepID=UPI001CC8FE60|nr:MULTISPECIES: hypothetical protein [unclassified Mesorhizobium]MBZ9768860.1 hypothetical protein [Mesorhizobium sp. CA6]MBZ9882726.1 hypothetical protein [Mesorhizobium sp. CA10]
MIFIVRQHGFIYFQKKRLLSFIISPAVCTAPSLPREIDTIFVGDELAVVDVEIVGRHDALPWVDRPVTYHSTGIHLPVGVDQCSSAASMRTAMAPSGSSTGEKI